MDKALMSQLPADHDSLQTIGEDRLVQLLTGSLPEADGQEVGPGDDCAVLSLPGCGEKILFKTDCLLEGIHYLPDTPAHLVGRKAMARALSDIAAMGGVPWSALVTVALRPETPWKWLHEMYRGLQEVAGQFACGISGGETSSSPGTTFISINLLGRTKENRYLLRSGGRPGDRLLVTGKLGGSLKGGHLTFEPRIQEGMFLAGQPAVRAMMDLSDGLAADLPRLARASHCGWQLDQDKLPLNPGCSPKDALSDGEDYELLVAAESGSLPGLLQEWKARFSIPLTEIGCLTEKESETLEGGYDHFQQR